MPWTYVVNDLKEEEIAGTFYEKQLKKKKKKKIKRSLELEKVIKRKGNKLYVKWKG